MSDMKNTFIEGASQVQLPTHCYYTVSYFLQHIIHVSSSLKRVGRFISQNPSRGCTRNVLSAGKRYSQLTVLNYPDKNPAPSKIYFNPPPLLPLKSNCTVLQNIEIHRTQQCGWVERQSKGVGGMLKSFRPKTSSFSSIKLLDLEAYSMWPQSATSRKMQPHLLTCLLPEEDSPGCMQGHEIPGGLGQLSPERERVTCMELTNLFSPIPRRDPLLVKVAR